MKKLLLGIVVGIAAGAILFWGYAGVHKGTITPWTSEYAEGQLTIGDLAPDLELLQADGSGTKSLSDFFREKPAVLVFGSYT